MLSVLLNTIETVLYRIVHTRIYIVSKFSHMYDPLTDSNDI